MSNPIVVLMNWTRMTPIQMAAFAHGVAEAISNNTDTLSYHITQLAIKIDNIVYNNQL